MYSLGFHCYLYFLVSCFLCVPCVTSGQVMFSCLCFSLFQCQVRISLPVSCFLFYFDSLLCYVSVFSFASPVLLFVIAPRCALLLCLFPSLSLSVFKPFVFLCLLLDCLCITLCFVLCSRLHSSVLPYSVFHVSYTQVF